MADKPFREITLRFLDSPDYPDGGYRRLCRTIAARYCMRVEDVTEKDVQTYIGKAVENYVEFNRRQLKLRKELPDCPANMDTEYYYASIGLLNYFEDIFSLYDD